MILESYISGWKISLVAFINCSKRRAKLTWFLVKLIMNRYKQFKNSFTTSGQINTGIVMGKR